MYGSFIDTNRAIQFIQCPQNYCPMHLKILYTTSVISASFAILNRTLPHAVHSSSVQCTKSSASVHTVEPTLSLNPFCSTCTRPHCLLWLASTVPAATMTRRQHIILPTRNYRNEHLRPLRRRLRLNYRCWLQMEAHYAENAQPRFACF